MRFIIINTHEQNAFRMQQPMQQLQPWIHHAQPLVVPRQVLAFLAHDLPEPAPDLGVVDGVVVDPALVAGVVWRVDVDAFHPALELGQQAFQGFQVVAVDDAVVGGVRRRAFGRGEGRDLVEHPERHVVVVVDHLVFPYPVQCWHVFLVELTIGSGDGLNATLSRIKNAKARKALRLCWRLLRLFPVRPRQRLAQEALVEPTRVGIVGPHRKLLEQPSVLGLQTLVLGL